MGAAICHITRNCSRPLTRRLSKALWVTGKNLNLRFGGNLKVPGSVTTQFRQAPNLNVVTIVYFVQVRDLCFVVSTVPVQLLQVKLLGVVAPTDWVF